MLKEGRSNDKQQICNLQLMFQQLITSSLWGGYYFNLVNIILIFALQFYFFWLFQEKLSIFHESNY